MLISFDAALPVPATSSFVLHPSSFLYRVLASLPLRSALSPSATTRRSALFPVGRPGRMEAPAEPDRKTNTTHRHCSTIYVCGRKMTEHVRFKISIPSFVSADRPGKQSIARLSIPIELFEEPPNQLLRLWIYRGKRGFSSTLFYISRRNNEKIISFSYTPKKEIIKQLESI